MTDATGHLEPAWRRPHVPAPAATAAFAFATIVSALLTFGAAGARSPAEFLVTAAVLAPAVLIGSVIAQRIPASPVGGALCWVGAAPALVLMIESWGETLLGPHPWPGAAAVFILAQGVWVWNLAGFVALCLVFPDGPLRGRPWSALPWLGLGAACLLNAAISFDPAAHRVDGVTVVGYALHLPEPLRVAQLALAAGLVLAVLAATAASLAVRHRRADEVARAQLRWLVLSAGAVPVLLGLGWIAGFAGVPVSIWGSAFLIVILLGVPAAVAIAILRHGLYDVDRLLTASVAWLLTTLVSAAVFAIVVYGTGSAVGGSTAVSTSGAAFLVALLLLPLHRVLHQQVGRVLDRERAVIRVRVDDFVVRVRDGQAQPEQVQALLRSVVGDPELRLLLRLPGARASDYVDIEGRAAQTGGQAQILLVSDELELGVVELGTASARRVREARVAASTARLPIEVVRLRIELHRALDEVSSSRARLLAAVTDERQRLERDLHDGAQQQILAVGMRLRSLQRRLGADTAANEDLDAAVAALEAVVGELRRLAHGVRPSRLDDGIDAALRALVAGSPIPVQLEVDDVTLPDVSATTVYFVVAEALANALKHARATRLRASVRRHDGGGVVVRVSDDGIGGAQPGFGLTSLRDRVAAAGGRLTIDSPRGRGTSITAELACAS